jgi:hypothetical protein
MSKSSPELDLVGRFRRFCRGQIRLKADGGDVPADGQTRIFRAELALYLGKA